MGGPDGGDVVSAGLVGVVGSINVDHVLEVAHLPAPGETVTGARRTVHPGGKGANQAVAAARSGAVVEFVARVGDDDAGTTRIAELQAEGVGTSFVARTEGEATGAAFVLVAADGENSIVVSPGANHLLGPADIERAAPLIAKAALLVMQLEVPLPAIERAAEVAGPDTVLLLNCAPYAPLPTALLARTDVLVVNALEASQLLGVQTPEELAPETAARRLRALGPTVVVITLGPGGALAATPAGDVQVPAPPTRVVDTTGAGDAFVGALAARLAARAQTAEALRFAVTAGSCTAEHAGALPWIPTVLR
ncbi:MAG: ribokinase [Acidimicrobiales bacterium]